MRESDHEYDYRPTLDDTKSRYQLLIRVAISKDYGQECD